MVWFVIVFIIVVVLIRKSVKSQPAAIHSPSDTSSRASNNVDVQQFGTILAVNLFKHAQEGVDLMLERQVLKLSEAGSAMIELMVIHIYLSTVHVKDAPFKERFLGSVFVQLRDTLQKSEGVGWPNDNVERILGLTRDRMVEYDGFDVSSPNDHVAILKLGTRFLINVGSGGGTMLDDPSYFVDHMSGDSEERWSSADVIVVITHIRTTLEWINGEWESFLKGKARSSLSSTIGKRQLTWTQGMASAIQDYQRQISGLNGSDKRSMARQIGKTMADEWDDGWYIQGWARNQPFINTTGLVVFGRRVFVDNDSTDAEILKRVFALCAAIEVYGHQISAIDLPYNDIEWFLD